MKFFETIVNGIVFIHLFSVCSFLLYRKATDFCKLILYSTTFLKVFMRSRSCLVEFSGSCSIWSCHPCHLQIGIILPLLFIFKFLYFFFLSYCSDYEFQNSVEYGWRVCILLFTPDFRRNGYSFSPLSMILAIGLWNRAFIFLWYILSYFIIYVFKCAYIVWIIYPHFPPSPPSPPKLPFFQAEPFLPLSLILMKRRNTQ
jgi:hypothetical protein